MSQRRWGQTLCRKFLAQIPMSTEDLGSMTERQRHALAAMLTSAEPDRVERDPLPTESLRGPILRPDVRVCENGLLGTLTHHAVAPV